MKIFGTILLIAFCLISSAQEVETPKTLRIDIPNACGASVSEVFEVLTIIKS